MHITFQLVVDQESGSFEEVNVDFIGAMASLNIFQLFSILKKSPRLISFSQRNGSDAFFPGQLSLSIDISSNLQIIHHFKEVHIIPDFDSSVPVKIFLCDEPADYWGDEVVSKIDIKCNSPIGLQLDYGKPEFNSYLCCNINDWKHLLTKYGGQYFYHDPESQTLVEVLVQTDNVSQMVRQYNSQLINIRYFMKFTIKDAKFPAREIFTNDIKAALPISFAHKLTTVGREVYGRLKNSVLKRYQEWRELSCAAVAPIASICQYSGSGKSKLTSELTNEGPGAIIVLRESNEQAFPPGNNLSTELTNLIKNGLPDSTNVDLSDLIAHSSSITSSVLNFMASFLLNYFQDLLRVALKQMESSTSAAEAITIAYKTAGPQVPASKNEAVKDFILHLSSMEEMFSRCYCKVNEVEEGEEVDEKAMLGTGKNLVISKFICKILTEPDKILFKPAEWNQILKLYAAKNSTSENPIKPELIIENDDHFESICKLLKEQITKEPFVFILDEAHKLADLKHDVVGVSEKVTGFQLFRRALSYLISRTPLYCLTLGTKSVLIDMNPPHLDSFRGGDRTEWAPPIVLSGNFDIHKHDPGYSYYDFKPTYESLKNPLTFKMLASMGSPIWSSIPFAGIIGTAVIKLRNSSQARQEDAFVSWMIRTGMFANPKAAEAESLVAHRMADLFNLQDDLKTVSVFYPSQPVLAMAARRICQESSSGMNLFQSFAMNSTLLAIDRGELAESMAFMNTMLAVDASPNAADDIRSFPKYVKCFVKIMNQCPELEMIWRKKKFILESEDEILPPDAVLQNDQLSEEQKIAHFISLISKSDFSVESLSLKDIEFIYNHFKDADYDRLKQAAPEFNNSTDNFKVTTVSDFLLNLYGKDFEPYLMLYPQSTLEGLVNASHFVKLPNGTILDQKNELGRKLPLPNNLVKDTNRCVIDRTLLKFGLIKQCAFSLPLKYFGVDGIIPVCLKEKDNNGEPMYTYISIQVKAGERVSIEEVLKMQSRLHFVNCPRSDQHRTGSSECRFCGNSENLAEIYENHIALIISFGKEYERISNKGKLFSSPGIDLNASLTHLYGKERFEALLELSKQNGKNWNEFDVESTMKLDKVSACSPLITHQLDFDYQIRTFSCLWNETASVSWAKEPIEVSSTKKRKNSVAIEDLSLDDPVPAQLYPNYQRLYCISSLGFEAFAHLYRDPDESVKTAIQVLNPDWLIGDATTMDVENMVAAQLSESIIPHINEFFRKDRFKLDDRSSLTDSLIKRGTSLDKRKKDKNKTI